MKKTVGIIGFGSFGRFLAEKLSLHCHIRVFDNEGGGGAWAADLDDVAAADFVVLAIPLDAYEEVLSGIKPKLSKDTVVVDVCSVKEQPARIIKTILPEQPMVATHPLFGPESAAESVQGHTLVLCPDVSDDAKLQDIEEFASSLGLRIVKVDAAEHDREMSLVQGLTFFIAHALKDLNLHDQRLSTPSFKKLLQLAELERHHSDELFFTIEAGNNHTQAIRKQFIKLCHDLDNTIQSKQ